MACGGPFWDLEQAARAAAELDSPVELALLAEWCPHFAPMTPTSARWEEVRRYSGADIIAIARDHGLGVESVHASRDLGVLLSHPDPDRRRQGAAELVCAYEIMVAVGGRRVVVHAWDTYAPRLDPQSLGAALLATGVPPAALSIENLPLSDPGHTQTGLLLGLLEALNGEPRLTLDLNWSSLYANFDDYLPLAERIDNVHVHGLLAGAGMRPSQGKLDFSAALAALAAHGYCGPWTLELGRAGALDDFRRALAFIGRAAGAGQ